MRRFVLLAAIAAGLPLMGYAKDGERPANVPRSETVAGVVTAAEGNQITITIKNDRGEVTRTFTAGPDVKVFKGEQPAVAADVVVGVRVRLTISENLIRRVVILVERPKEGDRPPGDRPPGDKPPGDRPPGDKPPRPERPPGDKPRDGEGAEGANRERPEGERAANPEKREGERGAAAEAKARRASGALAKLDGKALVLDVRGAESEFQLADDVAVVLGGGQASTLHELRLGQQLTVTVGADNTVTRIVIGRPR